MNYEELLEEKMRAQNLIKEVKRIAKKTGDVKLWNRMRKARRQNARAIHQLEREIDDEDCI